MLRGSDEGRRNMISISLKLLESKRGLLKQGPGLSVENHLLKRCLSESFHSTPWWTYAEDVLSQTMIMIRRFN